MDQMSHFASLSNLEITENSELNFFIVDKKCICLKTPVMVLIKYFI